MSKTPVTLITGYLGSGKTTLVNKILASASNVAVLVNEFGAVGIDGELIRGVATENKSSVIELANGCLCCIVKGEFEQALRDLASTDATIRHIIIEASGAADPTSVIKLFWGSPELTAHYVLDGVVCVVDGDHFLSSSDPVVGVQAAVADLVLVSKWDRAETFAQAPKLREALLRANPWAEVQDVRATDLTAILKMHAYVNPRPMRFLPHEDRPAAHLKLSSIALRWEGSVTLAALQRFFRELVLGHGDRLVRTKAILNVEGEPRAWLIQGVQSWIEKSKAPATYHGANRLVILGHELDVERLKSEITLLQSDRPLTNNNPKS